MCNSRSVCHCYVRHYSLYYKRLVTIPDYSWETRDVLRVFYSSRLKERCPEYAERKWTKLFFARADFGKLFRARGFRTTDNNFISRAD